VGQSETQKRLSKQTVHKDPSGLAQVLGILHLLNRSKPHRKPVHGIVNSHTWADSINPVEIEQESPKLEA
jgi:hypothetical protein